MWKCGNGDVEHIIAVGKIGEGAYCRSNDIRGRGNRDNKTTKQRNNETKEYALY